MEPLVFAVTWQRNTEPIGLSLAELMGAVAEAAGVRMAPRVALSYGELARLLRERLADVAWVPPIVFLKLQEEGIIAPLVSHIRGAAATYASVLLVRRESAATRVEDLRGSIAGWVDPWSAAGYVLPRVDLFTQGIDPRVLFAEEKFFGSHDAAVRALLAGKADAVATFAQFGPTGEIVRGGFSNVYGAAEAVRVLARFDSIPCDVVAAHRSLSESTQKALTDGFVRVAAEPRWADALRRVFGVEEFRPGVPGSYDSLRDIVAKGRAAGLLAF